jgi:transcriptional regulator with XRE-family HTH domain
MEQGMRFAEIGQQLRAYRMESGLRAEEIAARLGVSRAALYRYEKGEVIKLDTVKRLAELLKVSPLSLLGIGVEYYSRPAGYFERIRQIEETAYQFLQASGPICYLTTTDGFDVALADCLTEAARQAEADKAAAQVTVDQVLALLASRKRAYQQRKPGIIALLSASSVRAFLERGLMTGVPLPDAMRAKTRDIAKAEMARIADQMETEPMGLQFGLLSTSEPTSGFVILRGRDRATLAVNPFRADSVPMQQTGVAMITGADEAVAAHQRVAESLWRNAQRGPAAAAAIRDMIAARG